MKRKSAQGTPQSQLYTPMTRRQEICFTEEAYADLKRILDHGEVAYLFSYPTKGPNVERYRVWKVRSIWQVPGRAQVIQLKALKQLGEFDALKVFTFPLNYLFKNPAPLDFETRDRSIRAFGQDIEETITNLTVGVVGTGKTGSAVVELLIMEGVKKIVVVDFDTLEKENRFYMTPGWFREGQPKAHALWGFAKKYDAKIVPVVKDILIPYAQYKLRDCDIVFCCADRALPRLVLSVFCSKAMIPLIETGLQIAHRRSTNEPIARGQIQIAIPGKNCLLCMHGIDVSGCRREISKGGNSPKVPAIVAFSRLMASQAVLEMINLFTGMSAFRHRISVRMDRSRRAVILPEDVELLEHCPVCRPRFRRKATRQNRRIRQRLVTGVSR